MDRMQGYADGTMHLFEEALISNGYRNFKREQGNLLVSQLQKIVDKPFFLISQGFVY